MKKLKIKFFDSLKNRLVLKVSDQQMSENGYNEKVEQQIAFIKKEAVKLKKYPVSPYFTQKVMNLSRTRQKEDIWSNMQIIPMPVVKLAFFSLIVMILFLFIPSNNYNNFQDTTSPDSMTILYNTNSLNNELVSDDQALQFALVN
ncbi:hypothetical protein JXQ31_02095 [candidate division KSB1 bacterium]|nr:hypothetical protein [candidate division KSB1 bacterium]